MKTLFPKPHPLSPDTKAIETDGKMYFLNRKGNTVAEGVKTTNSIYYWWFEHLRRNIEYRNACKGEGVSEGARMVFEDFGNIFEFCSFEFESLETQFSTDREFWKWWSHKGEWNRGKGAFLFSYQPAEIEPQFVEYNDLREFKEDVDKGDVKLIAISTCHSKSELRKKLTKLLSEQFEQTPPPVAEGKHSPKYNVTGDVNIKILKRDLLLWDAREKKLKGDALMDIYVENSNITEEESKLLKQSFKGINNYLYGWELKDDVELEKEFGWIKSKESYYDEESDTEIGEDTDEYIPQKVKRQIDELANYAIKNVFTYRGFNLNEETAPSDTKADFLRDACDMWAYVKLGMAKRTELFTKCKRARNKAYIAINRSLKRADKNIKAAGIGKFNLTLDKGI